MEVRITTGTKKILKMTKRIRGVAGGASASKTISILLWLIDYANSTEGMLLSVVSETFPHLKRGAIRDFLNIMESTGRFDNKKWNMTDCIYEFPHKSMIEFFSADQPGKVRGPRRDVIFINEANNISYETYTQLEIRTKDVIFLDWNPVAEFWWYSEVLPKQDVDFITLTYKDNEALSPSQVDALEVRKLNKNWWRVYGEGKLGDIEGRIYTDWKIIDDVPHEARLERYGLDFGYSNDPTAIDAVYKYDGGIILDEICNQKQLSNRQISDILTNVERAVVIADSSEPKSIEELMTYGITVLPSIKGAGSVNKGIQYVQEQRISMTKRSINLIKEYRNYMWIPNRDGALNKDSTPSPIWNHHMDACFVGDTKIVTLCGLVNIKDIQKGDFVLTHKGYEKVLKRFYNGYKQVNNYLLQFDTFSVTIECTPDHKIKTTQGWKQISKLQSGMEIYHDSYLGEKSTTYTQTKNIFPKEEEGCIPMYGNSLTGKFRKVLTSITKMVTRGITELKIWNLKRKIFTGLNTQNYDSKTILFSPKNSKVKEFNWLKFGINPPMELNGIKGTELSLMQYENLLNISVNNAGKFIIRDIQGLQNSVIQTAKLKHLEVGEEKKKRVYDLSVNKTHEYFANGILVHNCRYAINSFHPLEDQGEDMDIPDDTKRVAML